MTRQHTDDARTLILLATYNGADYLEAQLDSLLMQTDARWDLLVSDDGSSDQTLSILDRFAERAAQSGHRVEIIEGPQKGAATNFLSLLKVCDAYRDECSFLAFCDQDDVWFANKLERARNALGVDHASARAFRGRTLIVDNNLENGKPGALYRRAPSFKNALVQNTMPGNTCVFNPAAASALVNASKLIKETIVHDWWAYQVMMGIDATLLYDTDPCIFYRQHLGNEIGANAGLLAKFHRAKLVFQGRFTAWNDINLKNLRCIAKMLTSENVTVLEGFINAREKGCLALVRYLVKEKVYRQTASSTFVMFVAALLGKF